MSSPTCAELPLRGSKPLRIHIEPAVMEELVVKYLPLVKSTARRVFASLPPHAGVELKDLIQAGCVGLVNATGSYEPEANVPFGTFARYRVRGEILDSLRKLDCASRKLRFWQKQMEATSRTLSASLRREPTDEEISQSLGVEIALLRKKKLALRFAGACSPSLSRPENAERSWPEQVCPSESRPDALRAREEMKQVLAMAILSLPVRSREVIVHYYSNERTMKQIGEVMRVDESRISQIHKGALRMMARTLRSSGICSSTDV